MFNLKKILLTISMTFVIYSSLIRAMERQNLDEEGIYVIVCIVSWKT